MWGCTFCKIRTVLVKKGAYLGFLSINVPLPGVQLSEELHCLSSLPFPLNMMNVATGTCITSSGSLPDGEVFTVSQQKEKCLLSFDFIYSVLNIFVVTPFSHVLPALNIAGTDRNNHSTGPLDLKSFNSQLLLLKLYSPVFVPNQEGFIRNEKELSQNQCMILHVRLNTRLADFQNFQ